MSRSRGGWNKVTDSRQLIKELKEKEKIRGVLWFNTQKSNLADLRVIEGCYSNRRNNFPGAGQRAHITKLAQH